MPYIDLIVSDPSIVYRDGKIGSKGWQLTCRSSLANAWTQSVELTTDHVFTDLDGKVGFQDADASEGYHGHPHGTLTFWKGSDDLIFPDPPSYLVTLRLPREDLAQLTKTIADGLPLRSVNVEITGDGIAYGWEPDGSGKKWDNANHPVLAIEGFSLHFGEPAHEEIVPDPPEPEIKTDAKVLEAVRDVSKNTTYLLYAVVALIVIILLRLR